MLLNSGYCIFGFTVTPEKYLQFFQKGIFIFISRRFSGKTLNNRGRNKNVLRFGIKRIVPDIISGYNI